MKVQRIAVVIGTRPEAIKMAPIVHALKKYPDLFETLVISTAQHRQMLDQVFTLFDIVPDVDLSVMRPNQNLTDLTSLVLQEMSKTLDDLQPDLLLVQGDTTTVVAASLAGFYKKIPIGHVEAGLRSHNKYSPFPEEVNRQLASVLADIHFAPTALAKEKLLNEGIAKESVVTTGNTVVDALSTQLKRPFEFKNTPLENIPFDDGNRILFVTSHRRESWGEPLENTCAALKELVSAFPDLIVVYPVHMNPNVHEPVMRLLGNVPRIYLTDPIDYLTCINLMKKSYLILTDSGGIQEEAPALKIPALVLRELTERPEAFQAGMAKVVGTDQDKIVQEASLLLNDSTAYQAMRNGNNPYGDGHASERIVKVIQRWFQQKGGDLLAPSEEFNP
ncbi:MAG: UDP-N-acetylglucosamine 2-epimerase (non-hydrolyzing) [Thiomicrorhabdus sp.]|nr:UDP-N-acetylglucosamine 2-epimerase (non-hydrolyzing) [Thiomicrorhabdus sp.]